MISEDTNRLKKLVGRLLEMARADVLEPSAETTEILPLLQQLAVRYQDYRLTVSLHDDAAVTQAKIALLCCKHIRVQSDMSRVSGVRCLSLLFPSRNLARHTEVGLDDQRGYG